MSNDRPPSLATGAKLTLETWDNFVDRLRHDCIGEGVKEHCTAEAIFIVQARRMVYGIDREYTDRLVVLSEESEWFSPKEYWDDMNDDEKYEFDAKVVAEHDTGFMNLSESDQWDILGALDGHTVTGWDETWEYVNAHFTKDAAEAFIKRKKHDYRKGLRVYVDAQTYCWEYNTIKSAILGGRVGLVEPVKAEEELKAKNAKLVAAITDALEGPLLDECGNRDEGGLTFYPNLEWIIARLKRAIKENGK